MRESHVALRKRAAAVHERLSGDDGIPVPQTLTAPFEAFSAVRATFEDAAAKTDEAENARDAALDAIGTADDGLDGGIEVYAGALVTFGIGSRLQPFKGFSKYSPSQLKDLAYATEAAEVEALVKSVDATKPPAPVIEAGRTLLELQSAVTLALGALTKPQTDYEVALHTRDLLLPELRKALKTFRTHAASAWIDEPATLKAVFAPPPRIQDPHKRRAPKPTDTTPIASA